MGRVLKFGLLFLCALFAFLFGSCKQSGNDELAPVFADIDRGDTVEVQAFVDSLLREHSNDVTRYGKLARIYRHKLQEGDTSLWAHDYNTFTMCVFHLRGLEIDSVGLRTYYDSVEPGLSAIMDREASEAVLESTVDRATIRFNDRMQGVLDTVMRSTNRVMRAIERSAPKLVNEFERTIDTALRAFSEGMEEMARALEEISGEK